MFYREESSELCWGPSNVASLDAPRIECPDDAFALIRSKYDSDIPRCRKCFEIYIAHR